MSKDIIKWRGIPTTEAKINEDDPITVINRFKQKTISLPRIDDGKRWAGFPGITGISRKLANIIENKGIRFTYYVEPFAGTAKVYQALDNDYGLYYKAVLNDKSKFVYNWLKREFSNNYCIITNTDFTACIIKWDSPATIFVIDPPWHKSYYDQEFSCFDRKSVKDYDEEVLEVVRKIKGKFIITTRKENKIMLNSEFNHQLITSEYPVSGKLPKTLITTNLDL